MCKPHKIPPQLGTNETKYLIIIIIIIILRKVEKQQEKKQEKTTKQETKFGGCGGERNELE